MKYERILVAIDGSDGSKQALESAVELVGNSTKNLTLIHVFKGSMVTPVYGIAGVGYVNPEILENELQETKMNERSQGETILRNAKAEVESNNLNACVKTELIEGDAAKTICDYAELNHIDLILIGERGLSGLKKLVLGSVSKKVTSDADCSVLVVK
ncbi:universal stress protein [Bacillus sp. JJ1521]|uniref:universal stress protein n=1 Tax=Bacillus sp. JJ1521 TaxID=3122957 RepID=UPI002FFE732F